MQKSLYALRPEALLCIRQRVKHTTRHVLPTETKEMWILRTWPPAVHTLRCGGQFRRDLQAQPARGQQHAFYATQTRGKRPVNLQPHG